MCWRQMRSWRWLAFGALTAASSLPALAPDVGNNRGASSRHADSTATPAPHRPPGLPPVTPRDSALAVREARKLQNAFEAFRRQNLPRRMSSAGEPCDERIGRFCYWHREGDSLVAEPASIALARDNLLYRLDKYHERAPGDAWVIGQYVHYLVEARYDSSAVLRSIGCTSARWWCLALRGYALHHMQRYPAAEAVFDSVLTLLPDSARRAWTDLSLLLPDPDRERYLKLDSAGRAEFERTYWQLADPSYAIDGNDRKTEHYARVVLTLLIRDARNVYGLPWGEDLRELTLRYGPPASLNATWPQGFSMTPSIVGHDREPSYHFTAVAPMSDSARWALRANPARERYSPPYLDKVSDFDAQFALFRRGDSALIVAVYRDTLKRAPVVGVTDYGDVAISADSGDLPNVRLTRTAWKGVVAGIERFDTASRQLERARVWLAPPVTAEGAPALSTMLLYAATDTADVSTLQQALRRAMVTSELRGTRKVGLYWEMYGVPDALPGVAPVDTAPLDTTGTNAVSDSLPTDSVADSPPDSTTRSIGTNVAVTVTRVDGGGLFQWLARSLRLAPRTAPVRVGWHDLPGMPGGVSKSLVLDLTDLPPGVYRITVSAGPDDARRTSTSRDIAIR